MDEVVTARQGDGGDDAEELLQRVTLELNDRADELVDTLRELLAIAAAAARRLDARGAMRDGSPVPIVGRLLAHLMDDAKKGQMPVEQLGSAMHHIGRATIKATAGLFE